MTARMIPEPVIIRSSTGNATHYAAGLIFSPPLAKRTRVNVLSTDGMKSLCGQINDYGFRSESNGRARYSVCPDGTPVTCTICLRDAGDRPQAVRYVMRALQVGDSGYELPRGFKNTPTG